MHEPSPHETATIGATQTSIELLKEISLRGEVGVTELAEIVDVPKSTVHKHLVTLNAIGCVHQGIDGYRLGFQLASLGEHARLQQPIVDTSGAKIEELAEMTDEFAGLLVYVDGLGVNGYTAHGRNTLAEGTRIAADSHLHCSAAGKAVLSQLPNDQVKSIVDEYGLPMRTKHTIGDSESLFEELKTIREREIAFDRGEQNEGIYSVAVPVPRFSEEFGAIYVTGSESRMRGKWFEEDIPGMLTSIASDLESRPD